jgi:methyl-accepting chemotaxis protein
MQEIVASLWVVGASGQLIIATILAILVISVVATFTIRARYASMGRDLAQHIPEREVGNAVLDRIVREARAARHGGAQEVNVQVIVEHAFQAELRGLLVAERFVRAATGLVIILGLVGTFYGLSMSIGKLVNLVAADNPQATGGDLTETLTSTLTNALGGMSVAFTVSLFGIATAVVLTLLGVFFNVTDRRTALMVQIEAHVDRLLASEGSVAGPAGAGGVVRVDGRFEQLVVGFGASVAQLAGAVDQFESALTTFAGTTRDFREFNLHLKDNVQRMSLSFGDFSEALKAQVGHLNRPGRG